MTTKFRSCPKIVYNIDKSIPLQLYVRINADKENPNMKPLRYSRNMLIRTPIIVNPRIHIMIEYVMLVRILFLNT